MIRFGFRLPLVAVVSLFAFLAGCEYAKQPVPTTLTTQTVDGWKIAIEHYRPRTTRPNADPVVLVHGLGYNANFWDLGPSVSLAHYLQANGCDVYVPSLRGTGKSTKPVVSQIRQLFRLQFDQYDPRTALGGDPGLLRLDWSLDDHVTKDVPAIIDAVLKDSRRERLHWVGHSMGGMILYGYLGQNPDACKRIASFTAIGSPMVLTKPVSEPLAMLSTNKVPFAVGNAAISTTLPGIISAFAGSLTAGPVEKLFMNPDNMAGDTIRLLSLRVQEDISPGQLAQLTQLIEGERFTSVNGKTDYTAGVEKVTCRTLIIAGTLDNLCPIDSSKYAFTHLGAKDKKFVLAGRINNFQADYGHDDLVLGKHSREEIFPKVLAWVAK
ncbi:MAG: alpha/beta fold hydrolase [Phycisphaerae bacterium]|nr:alpha/beta fold hydrolase [Phycisphaerae bacterium]